MFEKASRLKLRFSSPVGNLSAEDLWDLQLTTVRSGQPSLNNIAKEVSRELKSQVEEDFVNPANGVDEALQLKMDIVKHVIHVKQTENEESRLAAKRRDDKVRILELIAKKQDQALESKSEEELRAMVEAL